MAQTNEYVIGIDFGTDSVRSVLVRADGEQIAEAVENYPRWAEGRYVDSPNNMFRQHPRDYLESFENCIKKALSQTTDDIVGRIRAIAVDTTGSTPVAVDKTGTPLALTEGFEENPNAMFILWKDHTAVDEAGEINRKAKEWDGPDYTRYVGGVYSSEWFWSKIIHTYRNDPEVMDAAYSWVEHCDWIPFLLTGGRDVHQMKRSRCAAGHKALWHEAFDGLPSQEWLNYLDPSLSGIRDRLFEETYTSDQSAGTISKEWADRLGLPEEVEVGVGAFDAHMGAVGGEIEPYYLSKVMGTSTCDILVAPQEDIGDRAIQGIAGQVNGSVIPGMVGLEAGQSAFGDVYSWFNDVLMWPIEQILGTSEVLDNDTREKLTEEVKDRMIPELSRAAEDLDPKDTGVVALDWLNGRRTPDANQLLKGAIMGLDLGTDAPRIFRSLVESTCFGAKVIVERFEDQGVPIHGVIGLGGVANKSPFVMQILSDVLDMPIKIVRTNQTVALGAAMFAATVAGVYDEVDDARQGMGKGFDKVYEPRPAYAETYQKLYQRYRKFGEFVENEIMEQRQKVNEVD